MKLDVYVLTFGVLLLPLIPVHYQLVLCPDTAKPENPKYNYSHRYTSTCNPTQYWPIGLNQKYNIPYPSLR